MSAGRRRQGRAAFAAAGLAAGALLWAVMVLGVSFLATPAKFLAPSLDLPTALDVGRHTFGVFIPIEVAWAVLAAALALAAAPGRWVWAPVAVACGVVALQAAWLSPVLDARVGIILAAGGVPPEAPLHAVYIGLEAAKLVALMALGAGLVFGRAGRTESTAAGGESRSRPASFRAGSETRVITDARDGAPSG